MGLKRFVSQVMEVSESNFAMGSKTRANIFNSPIGMVHYPISVVRAGVPYSGMSTNCHGNRLHN